MNPSDMRPASSFGLGLLVGALGCIGGMILAVALAFVLRSAIDDQALWLLLILPPICGVGGAYFYWSSRHVFWGAIAGTLLVIVCVIGLLAMWLSSLKISGFAW